MLLIDFDAQANLSTGLGLSYDEPKTIVDVLRSEKSIEEVVQKSSIENLDLIASNIYLDGIEASAPIVNDLYGHERLRKSVADLDYDYILIDTPPSLGWLTQSALYAANYSIICAVPEPYSILALNRLRDYHKVINENHKLELLGVVLTFWDERGATNQVFLDAIESAFPNKLFTNKIRRDIAVSRAIFKGKPVIDTQPKGRASIDYQNLAKEIMDRLSSRQLAGV